MSKFNLFKPEEKDVLVRGLKMLHKETKFTLKDAVRMNAPAHVLPRLKARMECIVALLEEAEKPGRKTRNSYWMGHAHAVGGKLPFHHRKGNRPYDSDRESALYRQGYSAGIKA